VEAHQPGARVLGAIAVAQLARPDPAGRAVLGDLLEEVEMGVEEEREPRREVVDAQPPLDRRVDVGKSVREGEGKLQNRVRATSRMW
jgi:hypothetical protein